MKQLSVRESTAFQERLVALTRAFGWHRPDSTPCGRPVPIAEAHALLELSRTDSLTQQELAAALNLQKSTVSRIVARLERQGWVHRQRNASDGRALDVALTAEGSHAARDLAHARARRMSGILEHIPEGQREEVIRALRTLTEAIHEHDE